MKFVATFIAVSLVLGLSARARMGDSPAETVFRYGQPVARTGAAGAQTSTQTFSKDGLTIVCGYVNKKVEMYSVSRDDRAFLPTEIEALLRTNGHHQNWTPPGTGFGPGTYQRTDGATATVTSTALVITSPKWLAARAQDKGAAAKAAAAKTPGGVAPASSTATATNSTPAATNTAPHVEAPAKTKTNAAPSTTTNSAP